MSVKSEVVGFHLLGLFLTDFLLPTDHLHEIRWWSDLVFAHSVVVVKVNSAHFDVVPVFVSKKQVTLCQPATTE